MAQLQMLRVFLVGVTNQQSFSDQFSATDRAEAILCNTYPIGILSKTDQAPYPKRIPE